MSPLTVDRIKKAKGSVKVVPLALNEGTSVQQYAIQVLENGAWVNVFVNPDRSLCEQAVRKATSQVILG